VSVLGRIAEAYVSARSLRASAQACGRDHGPLKFRLIRAAEALEGIVQLAVNLVLRAEKLEHEVSQLRRQVAESKAGDAPP